MMLTESKTRTFKDTDLKINVELIASSFNDNILTTRYIEKNGSLKYCICYIDELVNHEVLGELQKRLDRLSQDNIFDFDKISRLLSDKPHFPVKTIDSTKALNVVLKRLCKGKIAVLIEGSPFAMTLPYLFSEHFQNDLHYQSKFSKYVDLVSYQLYFTVSISLPAIFVALTTIHQDLLPQLFLMNLAIERQRLILHLPTIIYVIIILILFDLLNEVTTRFKNKKIQTLYSVAILLFVFIAVNIRLFQASLVFVIGLAGMSGLILPKLKYEIIFSRYVLLFLSAAFGLFGFVSGIMVLFLLLLNLKSFGLHVIKI